MNHFHPPLGLRNPHVQTILSSVGMRPRRMRTQMKPFQEQEESVTLQADNGVQLRGKLNKTQAPAKSLVILIHGWEGSADSCYMLSLSAVLLQQGYHVFRLNLRDHGDTHDLNKGIFHSAQQEDVLSALANLQARYPYEHYYLAGFSLGGNFALRIAVIAHSGGVALARVSAVCPVLNPAHTSAALQRKENILYQRYFVRKWKKSLFKKQALFPEYKFTEDLKGVDNLIRMNQILLPLYTPFKTPEEYFAAYSIVGDALKNTVCPCDILLAEDDMIIPVEDAYTLAANPNLHTYISQYGGHCGFLKNWKLQSWQDDWVLASIQSS